MIIICNRLQPCRVTGKPANPLLRSQTHEELHFVHPDPLSRPSYSRHCLATTLSLKSQTQLKPKHLTHKREIEVLTIIGASKTINDVAGSAYLIDNERIQEFEYADINRILRDVPGLYLQEEDGFGQRPNIGIRGSGSDRSSRIALLEDGVLIAPAPYSAPSAYYFPTAKRMQSI